MMTGDTGAPSGAGAGLPSRKPRGIGFWLLVIGGPVALFCCGGGALLLWLGRDWIAVASAPESERAALFAKKLEEMAAEHMTTADVFLAAVGEERDDDAWNLTSPGFRAAATREQFGELAATVRNVMGTLTSRTVRRLDTKTLFGGPTVTTLVLDAKFTKGDGTITLELEPSSSGLLVRGWRTDSPLVIEALRRDAAK